jgi:hypothetical protein
MPTYSIDGPDGKTYSIDGPAGATREQVIAKIKERQPQTGTAEVEPSTLGDVATSFGRGVVKGAIGMAGLPGDVSNMVGKGVEKAGEFLGAAPQSVPELPGMPSSGDITKKVEGVAGKFEEPKTTAGKYVQSVGEFVPSAVIGPGGALTKAATTVAGGLGSEAGAELAPEGYEGAGRFVGGLVGGIGAGTAAAETAERGLARQLPGKAENYTASKNAFDMVKKAGVKIEPTAVNTFLGTVEQDLQSNFITRAGEGREIFPALDKAKDGDLAELIDLHSRLGKVKPNRGELHEAAVMIRPQIREFIENLQQPQLISGDPRFVSQVWGHARDTWRVHAKLSEVEQAAEAATTRKMATGRGMNWNTFRQEFKKILLSDDKTRGYSDEAVNKIEKIVRGTFAQNAARVGSAMAPQRGVLGAAPAAFALAAGGVEPAGIVATIGEVSHLLEGYLTKRQIKQLEDLIKRESPLASKQTLPDRSIIAPAAALRSEMAAGGNSPLAQPGQ